MSVTLTGTDGLFTRLGRVGKIASLTRIYQAGLETYFGEMLEKYNSLRIAAEGVATLGKTARLNAAAFMPSVSEAAKKTLLLMMKADKPGAAGSVSEAIAELIKQMRAASQSVQGCTVSASTSALSTNSGDGVCVVTTKRGDGLTQELAIPETAYLLCTADAQTGGTEAGEEIFAYTGEVSVASVWDDEYPIGSGTVTEITAVDATTDAIATTNYGNLLTNSDFEDFTGNVPDDWTAAVGTAAVNFQRGSTAYSGTYSLQFIGSAVNTSLTQTFNTSAGTLGIPLPSTSYAVQFWAKVDVVPAAGVLTVDLIDGNGTTVNDDQGVANSETFDVTAFTTSFASKTAVFRLPKLVPSTLKIRLRMSTALSTGSNLFVDHLAMGRMTGLYAGGPGVCVFAGGTNFAATDGFTLTVENNYGGSQNLDNWNWLFDRLYGMRNRDLILPVSNSPTIADTLITAVLVGLDYSDSGNSMYLTVVP